jgi:hypothetical protein
MQVAGRQGDTFFDILEEVIEREDNSIEDCCRLRNQETRIKRRGFGPDT